VKKLGKQFTIALVLVVLLTVSFATVVFAADGIPGAGYGQSSDGEGPDLQNQWGLNAEPGENMFSGYGECSEGAGPGLENQWGKNK